MTVRFEAFIGSLNGSVGKRICSLQYIGIRCIVAFLSQFSLSLNRTRCPTAQSP
jgi:hypothetical protein